MTQELKPIENITEIDMAVVHYGEIDREEYVAIRKEHFYWLCDVVRQSVERVNKLSDNQK